jgi:hypothetical protein
MGVRFPLEPTRPDLSELQEIAPVTKGAPEQNAGPRPFSEMQAREAAKQDLIPPDSDKTQPDQTQTAPPPSAFETTGQFLDILA